MQIHTPAGEVGPNPVDRAPSPHALDGLKRGRLDNTKPNARILLERVAERLVERTGCELTVIETKNAALAAPEQVMGRLTKEVELVLTGSAD